MGGPLVWFWVEGGGLIITPPVKRVACYEMLHRALLGFCGQGSEPLGSVKGRKFLR
jgi:hypothetical protein